MVAANPGQSLRWAAKMTGTLRTASETRSLLTVPSLRKRIAEARQAEYPAAFDTAVLRSAAEFAALAPEWNDLFERAARSIHVFQTFGWMQNWLEAYCDSDTELATVTVRSKGRLICIWPMQLKTSAGLRELRWMGEPVGQYGDAIVDPHAGSVDDILAAALAAAQLALRPDVLTLRKVRDDSNVAAFLENNAATTTAQQLAPFLNVATDGGYGEYAKTRFGRRVNKERRRLRRRLEERGSITFDRVTDGVACARVARDAIEQKRTWLDAKSLSSAALFDDRFMTFFETAVSNAAAPTGSEVHALRCNGELVAAQISFRCKRRMAVHIIVYNLDYQKTGAGVLHLQDLVERAFADEDVDIVDLLAPMSDYKMDWATDTAVVKDYSLALTWRGKLYSSLWQRCLRPAIVTAVPYIPLSLRRIASI